MLSNVGLNTHSNRTISVELKEDGKDSSITQKTEYMILRSSV
ncbi:conserved pro-fuselloviral protein [Acidianus hospitalis W1]|uniref:Conserved pro-fuselloviral protein n=1 Tax=Acidianus hospitalis (strain W1) TaxID=933801 RepID=F4B977_ACIHW|nr:conserved pro-fuselloviral protein [Acidianus hospitalis W1]